MVAIHLIPCFLMWSPEYLHPPKSHRHERHGGAHFQNELSLNESEKMVQDAVQGVQKQNESVWQRGWDRVKGMGEKGVWVGHKKRVQRNCEEERKTGWHKQNNQREREREKSSQMQKVRVELNTLAMLLLCTKTTYLPIFSRFWKTLVWSVLNYQCFSGVLLSLFRSIKFEPKILFYTFFFFTFSFSLTTN